MTIVQSIPSTMFVAIDISKYRHEVLIGILGKERRRRLTIPNTLDDFERLAALLTSYDLPDHRSARSHHWTAGCTDSTSDQRDADPSMLHCLDGHLAPLTLSWFVGKYYPVTCPPEVSSV
ncbi:hypothetical protein SAMN06265370_1452 [Puniceibacterium sediminis]|uniref:Transposase n=1 Tax=Puniceibacterium sediminis TaxID=1608407 RepID=A0A238ZVP1_9RHOB|nr:hypothetical protein [Puniceibacterium sediminis]SNR87477.1 hypothetical protein SAMN06265370_1452 [Puniceibacterium sediminis]